MSPIQRFQTQERETSVPLDLLMAIDSADITFRAHGAEDGSERVLVRCTGLGMFYHEGMRETVQRIARCYEVPGPTARKAAKLLVGRIAEHNRARFRPRRRRRMSRYVQDCDYFKMQESGGFYE